jgi:CRP-like cAMP-binding protein
MELLAEGMRPARFEEGARLMTEGEPGDTYVILDRGRVAISVANVALGEEGPGAGLGEIALLRAGPRTATVTALEPVEAWVIDCSTFLGAVTGHEGSATAAAQVVEERLGRGGADGADGGDGLRYL